MYALINQGAELLGNGVAMRPGDIDIVWIYGYGFPWWHGGPMWYADDRRRQDDLRRNPRVSEDGRSAWQPHRS